MMKRITLPAGLLALFAIASAGAQETRLKGRTDTATFAVVTALMDSARRAGLPSRAIEDKALEGISAGANGTMIVHAVRTFTNQLGTASSALGPGASADELRAAVGAIDAGVPSRDLTRIRSSAGDRSVATAMVVIGDIVVRGVPVSTATNLVISLLRARVKDAEILDFDRVVRLDIANGADPTTAASARARGTILIFGISKAVAH